MNHALVFSLLFSFAVPARADLAGRCEQLRLESGEVPKLPATACDEARETHATYLKALPEALELCKRLQAEALAGPVQLKPGTTDQMQQEAMSIKQRHITEQSETSERVIHELLPTPVDNNDLSRINPKVSSECGSEIENHVSFRRNLLDALGAFHNKILGDDELLFQQALDRGLPDNVSSPAKNVR